MSTVATQLLKIQESLLSQGLLQQQLHFEGPDHVLKVRNPFLEEKHDWLSLKRPAGFPGDVHLEASGADDVQSLFI